MKAMMIALIALTATVSPVAKHYDQYSDNGCYNVWGSPGLHLMMSDNGTPDDYSDDWVIDWEDNREVMVTVLDE